MDENYSQRYCAYVDVLAFRDLITDLGRGAISVAEMRDLLTIVHQPSGADHKHWRTEFRAQSISDAVAISTAVTRFGLIEILRALEVLTGRLVQRGHFIRGALVKGPLYHDDKMIFGEALVHAYHLERGFPIHHLFAGRMLSVAVFLRMAKFLQNPLPLESTTRATSPSDILAGARTITAQSRSTVIVNLRRLGERTIS